MPRALATYRKWASQPKVTAIQGWGTADTEALIELVADPAIVGRGAMLDVRTAAGVEQYKVTSVPGDPDQPLTPDNVRDKAITYMSASLGDIIARRIADAILDGPLDAPLTLPTL